MAADWNADKRTRPLAHAQVMRGGLESFDPSLGEIIMLLTTQMALAVAGNALYDLIKDLLVKQLAEEKPPAEQEILRQRITIQAHSDGAAGGQTLVVTIEDRPSGA